MFNQETDFKFLRYSFLLAEDAKSKGIHPFSAVLVNEDGEILLEQINGYLPDLDMTGHAERLIMTTASKLYRPDFLNRCTLYISAEPCAMCAGAIYWSGVGRIVYGLSEQRLKAITGNHPENPTLALPCRTVFESGQREVDVIGPLLEDEAEQVQLGVWQQYQAIYLGVEAVCNYQIQWILSYCWALLQSQAIAQLEKRT